MNLNCPVTFDHPIHALTVIVEFAFICAVVLIFSPVEPLPEGLLKRKGQQ
jgi:hypothetical protein